MIDNTEQPKGSKSSPSNELDQRADAVRRTMEQIKALRATGPKISLSEILEARHEGHRANVRIRPD